LSEKCFFTVSTELTAEDELALQCKPSAIGNMQACFHSMKSVKISLEVA